MSAADPMKVGSVVPPSVWQGQPFWQPITEYAPGQSPYRVKGLVYRNTLADIDAATREKILDDIEDAAMRAFFRQPFLAGTMVDVLPHAYLLSRVAQELGTTPSRYAAERAAAQARDQLSGVYRFLLKLARPGTVGRFLPKVTEKYFDFGTVSVEGPKGGPLTALRSGVPLAIAKWYVAVSNPFVEEAMELAGAVDPSHRVRQLTWDAPDARGLPRVTIHYAVRWS